MKIPKKNTVSLIEEIPTDGHSPLKFICNDGEIYFCKYRVSQKEVEIDCLVYEVVCSLLLKALGIPTPEIAFVQVTENSYNKDDLNKNRLFIKPGVICFGSNELKYSQLVTELDKISSKSDFKKYVNPDDIIRIALFDMWVGNTDRGKRNSNFSPGRSNNYNLLTKSEGIKSKIFAFDHGFAFGGENRLRIFNELFLPDTNGKLFGTQFFENMLIYIPIERRKKVITEFIENIKELNVSELILFIYTKLPLDWKRHPPLKDQIVKYLKNTKRINALKKIALNEIMNL